MADLGIIRSYPPDSDSNNSRTPLAWQHRHYKFHKENSSNSFGYDSTEKNMCHGSLRQMPVTPVPDYYGPLMPKKKANTCFRYHHARRPLSPNSIGSSTYEPECPVERLKQRLSRNRRRQMPHHSLRSIQSVPVIRDIPTWDGEPCPVHHSHPVYYPDHLPATMSKASSTYDMCLARLQQNQHHHQPLPLSLPPPPLRSSSPNHLESNPYYIQPPPKTLPMILPSQQNKQMSMMTPHHPLVIPAKEDLFAAQMMPPPLLPLPVRDPNKRSKSVTSGGSLPSKESDSCNSDDNRQKHLFGIRGGLTVLWIIICVIVLGVLLALVLCFTIV